MSLAGIAYLDGWIVVSSGKQLTELLSTRRLARLEAKRLRNGIVRDLRTEHRDLFDIALEIEARAKAAGNANQGGLIRDDLAAWSFIDENQQSIQFGVNEDRCHSGGCFT